MSTVLQTARPAIKICVPVDRHIYGPRRNIPFPSAGLMEKADVLDIRIPEYLKGLVDLKEQRALNVAGSAPDDELKMREVHETGKSLIYHHGGGFVEDHCFFRRKGMIVKDEGLPSFIKSGCLQALSDLRLSFVSFGLHNTAKISEVVIADNWLSAEWGIDKKSVITKPEQWMEIFSENLKIFGGVYKGSLGFENDPWHIGDYEKGLLPYKCRARFIDIVYKAFPDIFFHLDIAHAKVAAWNLYPKYSSDPVETVKWYMGQLPLDRVMAVHISGTELRYDGMHELHGPPQEEDYGLLEWLLPRAPRLEYVESEDYKSDEGALTEQVDRLREMAGGSN